MAEQASLYSVFLNFSINAFVVLPENDFSIELSSSTIPINSSALKCSNIS